MSFLAPLYMAGLLAVSLPIVFHLIRRTPSGQVPFSSLMFLSPSPPRITRRSRLNNILLLILRGAALSLLAFAFARPLLRDAASLEINDQPSRRVAILLDRSASLRREDLWQQAVARTRQAIDGSAPADQLALLTFGDRVETIVDFETWNKTPAAQRAGLAKVKLQELTPSWGATELGEAIVQAADLLADASDKSQANTDAARQIILVTDLQQGARLEALQAYAWPKGLALDVQLVRPKAMTNAGLHLAADADEPGAAVQSAAPAEAAIAADGPTRPRVSNEADSTQEQFTLHWANPSGEIATVEPIAVHVAPGTSRLVKVPRPAAANSADRLVLHGDDHDFDNTLYLVPPRQEELSVVYFGSDAADDSQGLRYYLQRALTDSPRRKVRLVTITGAEPLDPQDAAIMRLAIFADPVSADTASAERLAGLRKYVSGGGRLLVPLLDGNAALLRQAWDMPALEIAEAPAADFALLGEVAYSHPLFAPFADPRFSDFTKIHFWKHRRVKLPADAKLNVLARFDDGDPAVIEQIVGAGSILVLTSTWRPLDSQLALSSKFVPLLSAMLDRPGEQAKEQTQFTVGDGQQSRAADASRADQPGVYEAAGHCYAVNLAADESRTAPLGVEELERRGALLGSETRRRADAERHRQLLVAELENQQKLWQWLIVAVLGFVIAETALAGHLAGKLPQQSHN